MVNVEQLAEQIISSQNPQTAFNKISETLSDNWKTTLAREVNKRLFLKNLNNSELNQSIEFDVVNTPTLTKQAEEQVQTIKSGLIEKVASCTFDEKKQIEKKASINPDMFKISDNDFVSRNTFKTPVQSLGSFITKEASEKGEKELSLKQMEIDKEKELEKKAMLSNLKMAKIESIEKIANITNNPSELRQIIKICVTQGMEKVAEEIANVSVVPSSYIEKVASVELDFNVIREVNQELKNIKDIDTTIEKVALWGPLAKPLGKGLEKAVRFSGGLATILGKWGIGTAKKVTKTMVDHPIVSTIIPLGYGAMDRSDEIYKEKILGVN